MRVKPKHARACARISTLLAYSPSYSVYKIECVLVYECVFLLAIKMFPLNFSNFDVSASPFNTA